MQFLSKVVRFLISKIDSRYFVEVIKNVALCEDRHQNLVLWRVNMTTLMRKLQIYNNCILVGTYAVHIFLLIYKILDKAVLLNNTCGSKILISVLNFGKKYLNLYQVKSKVLEFKYGVDCD